jgi:hypothetical protein
MAKVDRKHYEPLDGIIQTNRGKSLYPKRPQVILKKATALYFRQFSTYGFDKKKLGSQDKQDWLCKNSTKFIFINF